MKDTIIIFVEGGVVHYVDTTNATPNCRYVVIDWDDIETDPAAVWARWDAETLAWFAALFPEELAEMQKSMEGA